jgi:hypothetical protein
VLSLRESTNILSISSAHEVIERTIFLISRNDPTHQASHITPPSLHIAGLH